MRKREKYFSHRSEKVKYILMRIDIFLATVRKICPVVIVAAVAIFCAHDRMGGEIEVLFPPHDVNPRILCRLPKSVPPYSSLSHHHFSVLAFPTGRPKNNCSPTMKKYLPANFLTTSVAWEKTQERAKV